MKLIENLVKLIHHESASEDVGDEDSKMDEKQKEQFKSSINFMRFNQKKNLNDNNDLLCDNILIKLFSQQEEEPTTSPLGLIQFQNECIYLNKNYFIVGRKSKFFNKCDLNIEKSNFVSRIHFIIELNSLIKKFFIYCVSKNGIFINNRYLQRGTPTILDNK